MQSTPWGSQREPKPRLGRRPLSIAAILVLALSLLLPLGQALAEGVLPRSSPGRTPMAEPASTAVAVFTSPGTAYAVPGEAFGLAIQIAAGANEVNAADIHLSFDPRYLQVVQAPSPGRALPGVLSSRYDNVQGTIDYGACKFGGSVSGTFTLVTIVFRAVDTVPSPGTVISGQPLVASNGAGLQHTWVDGHVVISAATNTPLPTNTPKPTNTYTPQPTPTNTHTFTPIMP